MQKLLLITNVNEDTIHTQCHPLIEKNVNLFKDGKHTIYKAKLLYNVTKCHSGIERTLKCRLWAN